MEENQMLEDMRIQNIEHKAWITMFNEFEAVMKRETGVAFDGNNVEKFGRFFALIDNWGFELAKMRIWQRDNKVYDVTKADGGLMKSRLEVKET